MDEFRLDDLVDWFKRGILWVIVTVIFTSAELRDEAARHFYSGVIRIPGVCYGFNFWKGYQAIGQVFPERSGRIRLDYILGYVKILLLIACVFGLIAMMAKISGNWT
jgi:hypothetical protein